MAALPLQAMDLTSLKAVLAELRTALLPSRFEKAQQADGHTVQIGLRTLRSRLWLELSWLAEAPRLLAVPPPPRQGEGSTLAQQLQHGLGGLALVELVQPGWERVVELQFAARPGETPQRSLVLELMGRHSNLFLLDATRSVVAAGRQVRPQQSRLRPIGTGDLYTPPPPPQGRPPSPAESFERWQRRLQLLPLPLLQALQGSYQGISPALARQLCQGLEPDAASLLALPVQELSPAQWQGLWQRWQQWLLALEQQQFCWQREGDGDYRCWSAAAPGQAEAPAPLAINAALAAYHQQILLTRELGQRQHSLAQRLQQALRREQQQAAQQQALLNAVAGSDSLQHQADAILCQPSPSKDQIQEAQKLYKQARKLRRSVAAITPRLAQHQQRIAQLEASLTYLQHWQEAGGPADDRRSQLQALEDDSDLLLRAQPPPRQRAARASDQPTPLELRSPDGVRLQVGRNHRQNEWISLQQARRGDLWFHAQECPGSHVVLKSSEQAASDRDLQAAADLAAHFSRARGNSQVPVVMVPTQQLQRIPGSGPGTVRHRGGDVLWADPSRAAALLAGSSLGATPEP